MSTFKIYKSYSFRDKDPIIDRMRTVIADEGLSHTELHMLSDVSTATMYNWFNGKTRRPTHACVAAILGAMGYDMHLVKRKGSAKVVQMSLEKEARKLARG